MVRHLEIAGLLLIFLLAPLAVPAQQAGGQLVDSLEKHQARIEQLIRDRLAGLVPSRKFIIRVNVEGTPVSARRGGGLAPDFELPGFRTSSQEPVSARSQFRIDRIAVRVVVNDSVPPSDIEYFRTIVPILADFDTERGDNLNFQVMTPEKFQQESEAGAAPQSPPEGLAGLESLSLRDWILLGALGLILLVLLIVMFRVLFLPKPKAPEPLPVAPAMAAAATAAQVSAEERRRNEQEQKDRELMNQLALQRDTLIKSLFARTDLSQQLLESMGETPGKLSGLIHSLGTQVARSALLPHMSTERYQSLEQTVLSEKEPEIQRQIDLLREANLFMMTQELVQPEVVRPDPFTFLDRLSRGQVAHLIKDQPIKVKSLVLSRIDPEDTAGIMETYDQDLQLEVAVQIGNLHNTPLEMAQNVARELAQMVSSLPDPRTVDVEGPTALVDLMGRTSAETSRYLLKSMKSKDTALAEQVEQRFFLFDSITLVSDELLPQAVRTMPSATVVQALQGADQDIQRKVIMAFPEQARAGMVNSVRAADFDEETIREARRQVVRKFQALAAQGKIDLKQISDAWQSGTGAS